MDCKSKCVYLSPSVQQFNLYNGDGNEEEYMNIVADSVEKYLDEYGICYDRNSPETLVSDIINESNSKEHILHLAIHSNAAGEGLSGEVRGSEVYYYPSSEKANRFAQIIVDELKAIYPIPEKVTKKTSSTFAELRRTKAPAVLVEVAYHDNSDDAQWIRDNTDEIGRALALSVKKFIDEFCGCQYNSTGTVITMGGNLNVREFPDINSAIVGKLSNGTKIYVRDCVDKWYKINYNNEEAYVYKHYVSI